MHRLKMQQWRDVQSHFKAWQRHSSWYNKVGLWKVLHRQFARCSFSLHFPLSPKQTYTPEGKEEAKGWQPKILRKKSSGNSMGIQNAQGETLNVSIKPTPNVMLLLQHTVYQSVGAFSTVSTVSDSHWLSCILYNKQNDTTKSPVSWFLPRYCTWCTISC